MATFGDERLPERFWAKVRFDASGCWLWTGAEDGKGYGATRRGVEEGSRVVHAYRWAYEALVGAVPAGLQLDHLCRNTLCVNPAHLEPVTARENWRRGESPSAQRAREAHCKRGHEFTKRNTYYWRGKRICRACRAEDQAQRRRRAAKERAHV